MAKEHLQLEPHNIGKNLWWYEENYGVYVYVNHLPFPIKISWRSLRAALRRKDLPAKSKK
jgi:hypothetical protein